MLSVVITTYTNHAALARVLEGFRRQTCKDFELFVVNDGGPEVDKALFEGDMPVTYLYLGPETTDFRLAATRNLGLKHSTGERVMFVDEDCVPAYNLVAEHSLYGSRDVIVCSNRHAVHDWEWPRITDHSAISRVGHSPRCKCYVDGHHDNYEIVFRDRYNPTINRIHYAFEDAWSACTSYPSKMIKSIGGFWEEFVGWGGEDGELAMRCTALNCTILLRPDLCYYHLNHPTRESKPGWEDRCTALFEKSKAMPDLIRNGGPL